MSTLVLFGCLPRLLASIICLSFEVVHELLLGVRLLVVAHRRSFAVFISVELGIL